MNGEVFIMNLTSCNLLSNSEASSRFRWCETNPTSGICEVLKWRAELKKGGMLMKGGGFKTQPPPNISQKESRQMMKAWCEDEAHAGTGPCG